MRYLINFSYDGSTFLGYQRQKAGKTVQGELEKVLTIIAKEKIMIHATSRTDVKVHAINQYAHFDINQKYDPDKFKYIINNLSDKDISIKNVSIVDNSFHARYNCIKKEYIYLINVGEYNPFKNKYIYQFNKPINIIRMRKASKLLLGKHDFRNFTTNQIEKSNCVRTILKCTIYKKGDTIKMTFVGDGFLSHMVRNIVGVLIDIGIGRKEIDYITNIFLGSEKRNSKSVLGEGLYLNKIYFNKKNR